MNKKVLCIIGPSGSGKTTVGKILATYHCPEIISHTTRKPRDTEIDGKEYYFTDISTFMQLEMIESVVYDGNRYGTSLKEIQEKLSNNDWCYAVVSLEGYLAYDRYFKNSTTTVISIYIQTNKETCIQRMKDRGDARDKIDRRIQNYDNIDEFNNASYCKYILNNTGSLNDLKTNIQSLMEKIKRE